MGLELTLRDVVVCTTILVSDHESTLISTEIIGWCLTSISFIVTAACVTIRCLQQQSHLVVSSICLAIAVLCQIGLVTNDTVIYYLTKRGDSTEAIETVKVRDLLRA